MSKEPVDLIGCSPAIAVVRARIATAAALDVPASLIGEPGTGKGLVARMIHDASRRAHHPLVALSCEGLPETLLHSEILGHTRNGFPRAYRDKRGLVLRAHTGSLLLQGFGSAGARLRPALEHLVRAGDVYPIGNGEPVANVDVRLMWTSHVRVRLEGIDVFEIEVPPLRERTDDIELLARHFLGQMADAQDQPCPALHAEAIARLQTYQWPGNVRELQRAMAAAFQSRRGDEITPADLP